MLVGRLHATVETSAFVFIQILIGNARISILGANNRMVARPELERDDITRQGVDAVWCEIVSRVADQDGMYRDFVLCRCGSGRVDSSRRALDLLRTRKSGGSSQAEC